MVLAGIEKMFSHLRTEGGKSDCNEIANTIIASEEHNESIFNSLRLINQQKQELKAKIVDLDTQIKTIENELFYANQQKRISSWIIKPFRSACKDLYLYNLI